MGVGIINFTFAVPAFFTIDRFGRRNLLLVTFPFLALFQLFNAIAFETKNTHLIIAGLYLFALAYSPGEGPVPFVSNSWILYFCKAHNPDTIQVYSAESMPLYIRDIGMPPLSSCQSNPF